MKDITVLCQSRLHCDWIDPVLYIFSLRDAALRKPLPRMCGICDRGQVQEEVRRRMPLLPLTASPGVTICPFHAGLQVKESYKVNPRISGQTIILHPQEHGAKGWDEWSGACNITFYSPGHTQIIRTSQVQLRVN